MSLELGNIIQFSELWPLQSYFDAAAELTTPQSTAALEQPPTNGIVPSTRRDKSSQGGYSLGLAPWSQTPVAVQFSFGAEGSSSPVVLKPGQLYTPNGDGRFVGFEYGLPFGWLGGGNATLFLFKTKQAKVDWMGDQSEILFHRLRTTILAGPAAAPSYRNWPNRFPWPQMFRYNALGTQMQNGKPSLAIARTTKILLRLNIAAGTITGDNTARVMFWGTDDFGTGADGLTAVNTDQFFQDISFPDPALLVAGWTDNPMVALDPDIAGTASNTWGISIVAPAGSVLVGKTVDICRYGLL